MALFDKFSSLFQSSKVDIDKRFEKLKEAVSGTMSKFYKARDRETDRIVGLKVGEREKVEAFEARFKGLHKPAEGKIAMLMKHPQIVETYEHGRTTDDLPYLVMEYLEGSGLHMVVHNKREGTLAGHRVTLLRQMAQALKFVHDQGYIHRDICPRNFILLPDNETIKLIDFGLTVPATPDFMQPGNRTGTPLYMAPEVVRRRRTDQRLDLFSFGVTAYYLCCFEMPWAVTEMSGRAALSHDTVSPIELQEQRPGINATLSRAIMGCLEPDTKRRTGSIDIFLQQIQSVESEDG